MTLSRTEKEKTDVGHLIKEIGAIAKEKNCSIFFFLEISPDGGLMIFVEGDHRIINVDWSEENILNIVRDVIRTTKE